MMEKKVVLEISFGEAVRIHSLLVNNSDGHLDTSLRKKIKVKIDDYIESLF